MSPAALEVNDLSVWFGTGSGRRQVVDSLSFSLRPGEASGLVGESGCGKTVAAMAILGLLPAHAASVKSAGINLNGRDISKLSAKQRRAVLGRNLAMIFQQPATALDPVFTIGQQIGAVYRRHNIGAYADIQRAVLASLESAGFGQPGEIAAAYPHELSGGMCQLAMIAMATVCKPSVIIADEPTTALDGSTRTLILQNLAELQNRYQTAILLISHDLAVVRQICRSVMVMYCGRVLESNDCHSFFQHARHPYSAGLLACIPKISATRPGSISAIPGQVPAADLPPGCHFAPRCERAEPLCRQSVPALNHLDGGDVACFRPL